MVCCFCAVHVDTVEEGVNDGWCPSFWFDGIEWEGPACPSCAGTYLQVADDGEADLREGCELPTLAIPLQGRPNKR